MLNIKKLEKEFDKILYSYTKEDLKKWLSSYDQKINTTQIKTINLKIMKSKEYLALKNFVHNELNLSKEDLNVLIKEAITNEVKAFIQRKIQNSEFKFEDLVETVIEKEINAILKKQQYGYTADKLYSIVGKHIAEKFVVSLKQ